MNVRIFSHLVGQLLLRTLDRAQRIHLAMLCRGFDGTIRIRGTLQITTRDVLFLIGCSLTLLLIRYIDLPLLLGRYLTGFTS